MNWVSHLTNCWRHLIKWARGLMALTLQNDGGVSGFGNWWRNFGRCGRAPGANQFYDACSGTITNPFGHVWNIATHVENVSHEEATRHAGECREHQEGSEGCD